MVESWRGRDCGHRIYSKYCFSNQYDVFTDWNSVDGGFSYLFLNDYMEEFKYPDWPKYGDNIQYRRKGG